VKIFTHSWPIDSETYQALPSSLTNPASLSAKSLTLKQPVCLEVESPGKNLDFHHFLSNHEGYWQTALDTAL